ncbi:GH3 auxin-responsive promoter family protein [Mucilaginibacter sp. KACC 22063]|uniref:GH3 auxin-responsive promoter family protein n=1 Tax=Mucilaginibacter sp. KACC 22063 TaxID=3025666 RepID=UPI0023660471|nr:GH3 auxin-responsive promoter family protein [Mucilaginibacter sp. KACC 22063]WDF57095.1 GH3 auxin-responsive promoter family protein [Mucilaginibacter sp. KACC 22063]
MGFKAFIGKLYANIAQKHINNIRKNALTLQDKTFRYLVSEAANTVFGEDHGFNDIHNYNDFKKRVPIRDYEGLRTYIDRIIKGEDNIMWPGIPAYLAKTSGTTSGIKYIPISKQSMPEHINAARNALLNYAYETGNTDALDGKMIFLQGSPELYETRGIPTGRLSGIVAHHVPSYLQSNRLPSYPTNCIEDWEEKVEAIVGETINQDMRLISGIPPWCQMYFDRLSARAGGKKIKDIFPNFKLFVYGGVNYEPYRARIEESIGFPIDSIETYPASEGFIAFQDSQKDKSLLLLVDSGIFYEFIPVDEFFNENPTRLCLRQIELNKNYVLILNTNAGLWGYNIGDTVKFVSKNPYKIVVTGRVKHYISAFGEHVIGEEVEQSLMQVANEEGAGISEFTVAPQVNPEVGQLPYHEWFIEFSNPPKDIKVFAEKVDKVLQEKNIYYADLIRGNILQPLIVKELRKNAFVDYMRSEGKLGGQNKVPRLSNDRVIADKLSDFVIK